MEILNQIEDKTLFITPNNIKDKILLEIEKSKKIYKIKFMTIEEFIQNVTFKYNVESIYYLMKKYDYKYENALNYIKNIYYINDLNIINDEKIEFLINLKEDLNKNNLLIYNSLFKQSLSETNVIIYGYNLNKYQKNIINKVKELSKIKIISENIEEIKLNIYEFSYIEKEIEFVATKIIDLIESDININNIKIANITDEYLVPIKRIFKWFNIPLYLKERKSIFDNIIVNKFIEKLKSESNIEIAINYIKNEYKLDNQNNVNILNQLITICNKYIMLELDKYVIEAMIYDIKNTKYLIDKKENVIVEILDLKEAKKEDYVFLIGVNNGSIPKIYKDEEYLNDNLKKRLNIDTSNDKNKLETKQIIEDIMSHEKIFLTYKLKSPFETFYKSPIVEDFKMNLITNIKLENIFKYSKIYNQIALTSNLDKYHKYNIKDENLDILLNTYKNIPYKVYNNQFTGIDKKNLYNYLNNKLTLSYSSLDNYFHCNFKYYLSNIIKIEQYKETFAMMIGSLYHEVLSKAFDINFNFDETWNNYLKEKTITKKEQFFLENLKDELLFLIETIKYQNQYTTLDNVLTEKKICVNKSKDINITFVGIIDKINYHIENNTSYVSIVDYKTGDTKTNLEHVKYGLSMQLPIYLYLIKNFSELENVKVLGFYLQKFLNPKLNYEKLGKIEKRNQEQLKLEGYTIDNPELAELVDSNYTNSNIIKSLKFGQNGFYNYSKVISEKNLDELTNLVDKKIDEAIENITNTNFVINPKRIGIELVGCKYCKFNDLCYKTEFNIIELEKMKKKGGEKNADMD